jgi:predicted RNA binding protein YcfA (HicA-like mRNA interferase family)
MKVDTKVAEKSLQKKGFKRDESKGHIYFYYQHNGLTTDIYTYTSHGSGYKEIGPDNLSSMRKQLKLETVKQTMALLECPMGEAEYAAHLIKAGFLDTDDSE